MNNDSKDKLSYSEIGKLGAAVSRVISQKLKEERIIEYDKNPKTCKFCGKELTYEKRYSTFCSHRCSAFYNNNNRKGCKCICRQCGEEFLAKSGNRFYCDKCYGLTDGNNKACAALLKDIKKKCMNCGKSFTPHRKNHRYCSRKCSFDFQKQCRWKEIEKYIEESGEFPHVKEGLTKDETNRRYVRRYLESKYGHTCSICGLKDWMGKSVTLIVDHIDGDPLNHKVDNFRLVCPNCDSQLPTYKSKNRGNGRKYRRMSEE